MQCRKWNVFITENCGELANTVYFWLTTFKELSILHSSLNSISYYVYFYSGVLFPSLSSKQRSEYISVKVQKLLLYHFILCIVKLINFTGRTKKRVAHEIVNDTEALYMFKQERLECTLIKELFFRGGAGKVKVLSHSDVCMSVIFLRLRVGMAVLWHQQFIISHIIWQQPVCLWHKMESQMERNTSCREDGIPS